MLKKYLAFVFLAISTLIFSQKRDLSIHTPWFMSINGGGTWHSTDVKTRVNGGGGLTLGYSALKKNNSPIFIDIYGRFLVGKWKGNDLTTTDLTDYEGVLSSGNTNYKDTYGNVLHNFKNNAVEFNLEAALHFKRIIQRTGWDPYIFGGFGLGFNRAWGNYLDAEYMYLFADGYSSNFALDAELDNSYETRLDKNQFINGMFTGHLGVGLGYYFTNSFSMGIEHKTTFTGVDYFDGVLSNNVRGKNDVYHYTNLYLKWYFGRGNWTTTTPPSTPPVTTNPPVIVNPPVTPPCITPTISVQSAINSTSSDPNYSLVAYVTNTAASQIQVTLNGNLVTNVSLQTNGRLSSNLRLFEGVNTIQITAWNNCGQDVENIRIQHQPLCDDPIVNFTNPRSVRTSTSNASYNYSAVLRNIQRGNLLQVYVNGVQQNNFNVNYSNGELSGVTTLHRGSNTIQIVATNNCGNHSQTVNIDYDAYCPTPIIQFNVTNGIASSPRYELKAFISNVSQSNQIAVRVNGILQTGINTSTSNNGINLTKIITLNEGVNTISVTATNSCGNEVEEYRVVYDEPCTPATIVFTSPRSNKIVTESASMQIQATIADIDFSNQITLLVNNVVVNNFSYNATTDVFRATVNLNPGQNTVKIIAKNDCSTVTEQVAITYTQPCDQPAITFVSPNNGAEFTTTSTTVTARVSNTTSRNDVNVYVNGSLVNNFTYSNGNISVPVSMIIGNNTIQIVVTTACGSQSSKLNIIYNQPRPTVKKPTVAFNNNCNIVITPSSYTFTGTINGVTSTDQITVLLNGEQQRNVQFTQTGETQNFNFSVRAGTVGAYTLTIIAANEGGTTSVSCTVTVKEDPTIDICLRNRNMTIKESQWSTYEAQGAKRGRCTETPISVDTAKIQICLDNATVTIYKTQWPVYQTRGAIMGKCPEVIDNDIIICVKSGNGVATKTIKESEWPAYERMGARLGECPEVVDNDMDICFNGKNITIKESQWTQYAGLGATLGKCPMIDPEIEICHRVGTTLTTIKIKQSEWPTYQQLGATLGKCPVVVDQDIVICVKLGNSKVTRTIKQSQWASYERMGATLGACSDTTSTGNTGGDTGTGTITNGMLICILENGEYVTKTINPLQWATYQAQGAIRGACTGNEEPSRNVTTPSPKAPVIRKPTQTTTRQPANSTTRSTTPATKTPASTPTRTPIKTPQTTTTKPTENRRPTTTISTPTNTRRP